MKDFTISINDLQPGMTIVENVLHNNVILLPAGITLTETYILKLKYLQLEGTVLVKNSNSIDLLSKKSTIESNKYIQSSSKKLFELSSIVKDFFNSLDLEDSIENHNLSNIQNEMTDNFELLKHTLKDIFINTSEDDYIYVHSLNVAFLSYLIGVWSNLNDEMISSLIASALLHDLGKSKINPSILHKNGELTPEEFVVMKKHPLVGYQMICSSPLFTKDTALGILTHHERVDGTGYPLKLKNSQIHLFGKIISVADTFSALTLTRPYKESVNPLIALQIMKDESFAKFDYKIWNLFFENMLNYYTGDSVALNTGEHGKIVMMYKDSPSRPLVYVENTYFAHLRLDTTRYVKSIVERLDA